MMRSFTAYLFFLLTLSVQGDEIPHAIIQTNLGIIEIKLNPEKAPETVENFLTYVKEGFYENTIFHRVVNNFVIQGGGYSIDYQKKPTHPSVPNEASNGLKNLRGTLAMARTADPNSSTSQFFINVKDNKFLDYKSSTPSGWGYCVFGKVVDGMDVVDKIARLPTDASGPFRRDVPQTPVIIEAIKVEYVPATGEETPLNSEEQAEEPPPGPAHQKKNTSHKEKASVKEQAPSLSDMQQEMLQDLDEIEEEEAKLEEEAKKEEALSEIKQEEEKKKTKDVSEETHQSEENSHENGKHLSQKEKSLQTGQDSDPVKMSEEPIEKKSEEKAEKVTDEQDAQEPEIDKKSSLKHVPKEPDKTEEDKTMLSVVTKKENALSLKKETKKATTPPDSPTPPDKPEPPMN